MSTYPAQLSAVTGWEAKKYTMPRSPPQPTRSAMV
jgi:hypothetical protein